MNPQRQLDRVSRLCCVGLGVDLCVMLLGVVDALTLDEVAFIVNGLFVVAWLLAAPMLCMLCFYPSTAQLARIMLGGGALITWCAVVTVFE